MPFHPLPPAGFKRPDPLIDCVRVSKAAHDGTATIVISHDLAMRLGDPTLFALRIGRGADDGRILLTGRVENGDASYRVRHRSRRGARRIRLTAHRIGIDAVSFPRTTCPHALTEDGLVIDLRGLRAPAEEHAP